ncbi:DUF4843 domain-containing protein [Lutibacter sp. A64]|uniref:DUF4843 domain-containing protein n=1 Tax=Lutibacter sp. A64 TaxID=2918526 RepID=UPI001F069CE7|nr:DUF4843 domain-containing protein [Lutibacter sp. A64]UMB55449.1 DUF4843 domain-containing protein [Lutibacter sp. A64]
MKNYILITILTLLLIPFVSCEENEIEAFKALPAVNFVNSSLDYSFVQNTDSEYIAEIPVQIIGTATDYDRYFNVEVLNDSITSADTSLYEIVEGKVPANAFEGSLFLKVKNAAKLDTTSVSVHLEIADSEDFVKGNVETKNHTFKWSNTIIMPAWTYYRYFFCRDGSTAAYRVFIAATGRTSFTISDYRALGPTGAKVLGVQYGNYIRNYNAEHPDSPLLHDDGAKAGEPIVPIY